jgi:hypothetical protein
LYHFVVAKNSRSLVNRGHEVWFPEAALADSFLANRQIPFAGQRSQANRELQFATAR